MTFAMCLVFAILPMWLYGYLWNKAFEERDD